MTQPIVLRFLMFQRNGSAALDYYCRVFPDAEVNEIETLRAR
jgi:predicted 3-demethylubiquinone-9 3-methyltransferase (glyoxalase superfamily)